MAELTAFGSRLLILQCSEAITLLTGSLMHSDFIPVHKRNGFCYNFHVTVHTCALLSEMRAAVCSVPYLLHRSPLGLLFPVLAASACLGPDTAV